MKGLVHIYTGNGKGKTTAAIGLGVRACGRGMKVLMVQFLKGMETGEINSLKKLGEDFILLRGTELKKFTWNMTQEELAKLKTEMSETFAGTVQEASSGKWDMLILDEIMATVSIGLLPVKEVEDLIRNKPENLEIIMTGRDAPKELIELADYVSNIEAVKHPFEKGIAARKGIEF